MGMRAVRLMGLVAKTLALLVTTAHVTYGDVRQRLYRKFDVVTGTAGNDVIDIHDVINSMECSRLCQKKPSCLEFSVSQQSTGENCARCKLSSSPEKLSNDTWELFEQEGIIPIITRVDASVTFDRPWADYKAGFGQVGGNYWIGLDTLHDLTTARPHSLYLNITDWAGITLHAAYSDVQIGPEADNYRLSVSGYDESSTAGDSLISAPVAFRHDGMEFTTSDRENDLWPVGACVDNHRGGWWYNQCQYTNPTGLHLPGPAQDPTGITWRAAPGYPDQYSFKMVAWFLVPA